MMDNVTMDVFIAIMDRASCWTAYCMALCCKDALQHYESGKCPHNLPPDIGGCDTISTIFHKEADVNIFVNKADSDDSDSESTKAVMAQDRLREEEWQASQNAAGRSSPLGDLQLGGITICWIKERDFVFICDNSDGTRSERQLLLIDDYFKIKKGNKYRSFVAGTSGTLTKFQARFPTEQYSPCRKTLDPYEMYCPVRCAGKRETQQSDNGLFDGQNSEDVHMSVDCHRGYECIGFDIQAVETSRTFRVKLELYDAEHYVS